MVTVEKTVTTVQPRSPPADISLDKEVDMNTGATWTTVLGLDRLEDTVVSEAALQKSDFSEEAN